MHFFDLNDKKRNTLVQIIICDIESYYDSEFTLSKLHTEEYVRNSQFEAHGCAFAWPDDSGRGLFSQWINGSDLPTFLAKIDWSNTFLISHHANFDHLILSHHYNVHPKVSGCTLSMARMLLGNHISVSLDSVRKQFGLPPKITPYNLFHGKRWHELSPAVREQMARGAIDEVQSIWTIFCRMMQAGFPQEELEVIDIAVKMFTEPVLRGDVDVLAALWESEDRKKREAPAALGVEAAALRSTNAFVELLEAQGIEVEYKEGKNGPIPALAKSDEFMQWLLENEDEKIRVLAEARIGAKSTILQTRAATLGFMATRGALPVYLRPYGAGTLRFSGGDGTNFQNFNRKDPDREKEASPLRKAIMAPPGYLLAPVDLSQIEARVLAYLAGEKAALGEFARGDDPYVALASAAYGYRVTKDMKLERGTGKQLRLSCGYGAAEHTIQRTARLGTYGPPVIIDLDTALRWKKVYRDSSPATVQYWKTAGRMISRLAGGPETQWGPLIIKDKRIYLPNGTRMNYDTLEYHRPTPEEITELRLKPFEHQGYWRVRTRHGWKTLHGSKLTQNICEAVSRVIVTQAAIRIKRMGYRILNIPHDELLVLVPDDGHAQEHMEACRQEMIRAPDWLPGIPLDAEGSVGERYEK